MHEQPIFIFASGWRTGSTLFQRVLTSHPDILIWGENQRLLNKLMDAMAIIKSLESLGAEDLARFREEGCYGWIPNLNPPSERFLQALKSLMHEYYGVQTQEFGKSRWGFKEVRYARPVARFLASLYPQAKFVLIVRNPRDCLASARATDFSSERHDGLLRMVGGPDGFLTHWQAIARSFLEDWSFTQHLLVRYEDFVQDFDHELTRLAEFLEIDEQRLDRGVLGVRQRGWRDHSPYLKPKDRALLASQELWRIAGDFGYECPEDVCEDESNQASDRSDSVPTATDTKTTDGNDKIAVD